MKRLNEAWFEFKGIRSDQMGIMLKQMPVRSLPGRNFTRKAVSGRDGTLKYGDFTYKDTTVRLECDVRDETKLEAILGWLTGSGDLRFSDEPDRVYAASIEKEYSRSSIQPRLTGQRFTVTWTCAPFRKEYDPLEGINITTSGVVVKNPGTATALPRVEIHGSGDFSLTIGMETIFFAGIDGGIVVDSELMDALNLEGSQLLNDKISGMPFEIQPGNNTVSWLLGDGGEITKVVITPRWRYI